MSSTELLEAASNSYMLNELELLKLLHDSHSLHASISAVGFIQLMVFAMILAHVVLPTPLGPQNKKACANVLVLIAFCKVEVMAFCPTTLSKVAGLYFLAETTKLSMYVIFYLSRKITSFIRVFLYF